MKPLSAFASAVVLTLAVGCSGGAPNTSGSPDLSTEVGSAGGASEDPSDDSASTDPNELRFGYFECTHDAHDAPLVDGQPFECSYEILGGASKTVTTFCEDMNGNALDCGLTGNVVQAQPFGVNPIPTEGKLVGDSTGKGGSTIEFWLVADDGDALAKYWVQIDVLSR